jgi:hypothetical protein
MAMRTHDTITPSVQPTPAPVPTPTTNTQARPSTAAPAEKLINSAATSKSDPRNDGTLSDSVLSTESTKKRRPSMSSKALVILGLSKKTNSASNLGYGNYTFLTVKR